MPEYRTYGARDDRIAKDGDFGFIGFNNRVRPDQLGKGMLADSQNMRLDLNGEAQVRKGIELIEAPFAIGDIVLRLPKADEIIDDETGNPTRTILPSTIKSASLNESTNVVTLVVESLDSGRDGHDWAVNDTVFVEGVVSDGTDVNGEHVIDSVTDGTNEVTITYDLTSSVASTLTVPIVLDFNLDDSGTPPQFTENIVTAGSFVAGTEYEILSLGSTDFTDIGAAYNLVSSRFTATGAGTGTGTAVEVSFQSVVGYRTRVDEDQVTQVYASAEYSDPNSENSQYVLLASNSNVVAKNIATNEDKIIDYTGVESVGVGATMLQAFNKVFIFREGKTALVWDGDFNNDFELVESGEYEQPVQIVCAPGEFAIIENRGIVHQQDGVQAGSVIEVLSAQTNPDDQNDQTSGLKEGARFDVAKIFEGGASQSITSATSDNANLNPEYSDMYRVTCTLSGHGYKVGDPIDVTGFGSNNVANGSHFVAEKTDGEFIYYVDGNPNLTSNTSGTVQLAHGFEFYINSDGYDGKVTDGLTLTSTPIFTRRVSVGLGFTHMPAPPYAIYHQRRLVMPFKYTVNDSENSYTLTGNADEIIASDILDSDTYDQIYAQYRFNAGTADFNVGLHSFANDTLIVFNRNSIHEVRGMIDLKNASSRLITDEVGLVARQSVVQVGSSVIFLSDNGVYNLQFLDEYNLRGGEVPMSEAINATMKRINQNAWEKSVAVYFDNRYYIAVPLDSSTTNNAIIIYNFINKQWESVDTVVDGSWDIENLIVAGSGNKRGVYAINTSGGIHRLDYRDDGLDRVVTEIGSEDKLYKIPASITTRQYTIGTMERKKWKEFDLHVQSSDDYRSDLTITAETENPDANFELGTLSSYNLKESDDSVILSGFDDATQNGTYVFDPSLSTGTIKIYTKGILKVRWIPASPYLETPNGYYSLASSLSTSPTAVAGDEWYEPINGAEVNGASQYAGGRSVPTTLAEGEDVSIRGRIGNRRGYGLQFTFNNTTGRPRIRAIETDGSASFRSTTKAD
jgi:hypothetical protein